MTAAFKALFAELHEAEEQVETARQAVAIADAASNKVRAAIWKAIDEAMAASAAQEDLRVSVARLEARVLELMNRLPPPTGGGQ